MDFHISILIFIAAALPIEDVAHFMKAAIPRTLWKMAASMRTDTIAVAAALKMWSWFVMESDPVIEYVHATTMERRVLTVHDLATMTKQDFNEHIEEVVESAYMEDDDNDVAIRFVQNMKVVDFSAHDYFFVKEAVRAKMFHVVYWIISCNDSSEVADAIASVLVEMKLCDAQCIMHMATLTHYSSKIRMAFVRAAYKSRNAQLLADMIHEYFGTEIGRLIGEHGDFLLLCEIVKVYNCTDAFDKQGLNIVLDTVVRHARMGGFV